MFNKNKKELTEDQIAKNKKVKKALFIGAPILAVSIYFATYIMMQGQTSSWLGFIPGS